MTFGTGRNTPPWGVAGANTAERVTTMTQMNSKIMEIVDEENGTMQEVCELPNGLYRVDFYERYTGVPGWRFIFSDGDYTKECLEDELGIVFNADQEG
jgi:hypothetical protein